MRVKRFVDLLFGLDKDALNAFQDVVDKFWQLQIHKLQSDSSGEQNNRNTQKNEVRHVTKELFPALAFGVLIKSRCC